jgi:hypothetical protein
MRRWTFLMIGGTLLLAAVFIGVQIYLLKSMTKSREDDKPPPPAWTTQTSNLPPQAVDVPDPREPLLAVIREQTKENLYQTFLHIGLLGDSLNDPLKRPLPLADAEVVLVDINKFLDRIDMHLEQVPPTAFMTDEDRKDMELAASVVTLLRTMAQALKGHCDYLRITMLTSSVAPMMEAPPLSMRWVLADQGHSLRYQQGHADTWEAIKKLLRLRE